VSAPTLVVGIDPAAKADLDHLQWKFQQAMPHVNVLLVWGASGMVLVPAEVDPVAELAADTAEAPL
jgi:hypothetical protein